MMLHSHLLVPEQLVSVSISSLTIAACLQKAMSVTCYSVGERKCSSAAAQVNVASVHTTGTQCSVHCKFGTLLE